MNFDSPLQDENERYSKDIVCNNLLCNFSLNNYLFQSLNNRIIINNIAPISLTLADNASIDFDFTNYVITPTKPLSSKFDLAAGQITGFDIFSINKITTTIIITSTITIPTQLDIKYRFNPTHYNTNNTYVMAVGTENQFFTENKLYLPLNDLGQLQRIQFTKLTGDNPITLNIIISIQKLN